MRSFVGVKSLDSAEMITWPGAVMFGSTRPSRDGPWLLKLEIASSVAPGTLHPVPSTSTHWVLVTWEPTHRIRLPVPGMPTDLSSSPGRKGAGREAEGGKKSEQ